MIKLHWMLFFSINKYMLLKLEIQGEVSPL